MHVKSLRVFLLACLVALFLSNSVLCADDLGDLQDKAPAGESTCSVFEESASGDEEAETETEPSSEGEVSVLEDGGESGQSGEIDSDSAFQQSVLSMLGEIRDSVVPSDPVEGEISDSEFKAFVLAFILFICVIILCYFGYKFFAMFF